MKIITLSGQIEILSGLHIGGGDDTMKIGGIDSGVIKDINTNKPYIPGSSIKGKMRSLLEWNNRLVVYGSGQPFSSNLLEKIPEKDRKSAINLLKIFGDVKNEFGITRVSFSDCFINQDSQNLKLSEAKYENVIDRQKGTASNPRQIERVPAGVKFDFSLKLKIFDEQNHPFDDDENELKDMIDKGIKLLENDYLGGSGSRGYGRVKFIDLRWSNEAL
ncbi:MAG: type III-A CRISPR-associated RAMP protein Csm3 [Campylobacter lanienae]|uniref:type III-A CRISPR-associated RAMP protein Csm3 n=1 Tax=Campylobacter lanienae TaxID=75658 RepID=UPI00242AFA90|nr:type III-A CRISPR-associated RAMP protein Csm3 [Campylobacter lanienae]MDD7514220.1 type III-A CRISPR-associated RAMP protein Csm3 [Campylobacter lanienae]MDY5518951.1 type III-A CRISPR-associated RAMP protein Csm3 [Campylobacter lanienae]MDY6057464.1 type III-A CRISPR-associated RAMP protein Csm3 [Campylobacter lanienae]